MRNGTFIAHLSLVGPHGLEHVDSRASDAIALAMRVGAPVLVAEAVLLELGAAPEQVDVFETLFDDDRLDPADEEFIEEELEEFRLFLSEVRPEDFDL